MPSAPQCGPPTCISATRGAKSTAGNLAFPFAPSDVPFGPVYAFFVYHLLKVPNGRDLFPIELVEV